MIISAKAVRTIGFAALASAALLALPAAAQDPLFGTRPLPTVPAPPLTDPAQQRAAEARAAALPPVVEDAPVRRAAVESDVFGAYLFQGRFAQQAFRGFNPDYVVSVGDRIDLKMWGAFEFQAQLEVDTQGNIFIPRVGPVTVANTRNAELNRLVGNRVRGIYRENVGVYAALAMAEPVKVFVTGNVKSPGLYGAFGSDSPLHFLDRAGGIDPETGSFLDVRVLRGGETLKHINLYDFLLRGEMPLFQFHHGDTILVGQKQSTATVSGLVDRPAQFEFTRTIRLTELLQLAGLDERATHVQIVRHQTPLREAEYLPLADGLDAVQVHSGDEVHVIADRHVGRIIVRVEGEFEGASQFVLPYASKLSDVLERVQLTDRSDLSGIQLFRESVAQRQKEALDQQLRKLEEAVLSARSGTREEAELRIREAEIILKFIERARVVEPKGRLVLHEGFSPEAVDVQDGDVLRIPRATNTVAVQGEVFFPTAFVHRPGRSAQYYIRQAGGMTQGRGRDRIFLARANGEILEARGGLFYSPRVRPGDEILVLPKVEIKTFQFSKDLAQVISQIALTAGVVLRL